MQSKAWESILRTVVERICSCKIYPMSPSKQITNSYGLRPIHCSWHYNKVFVLEKIFRLPELHQRVHFTVLPPKSAMLFAKTVSPFRTMLLLLMKIAPVNIRTRWMRPEKLYLFPLGNDQSLENTGQD